jgi:hypothetical protein
MRIADSLRGSFWTPEMRRLLPATALRPGGAAGGGRPGLRSWWESIHSWASRSTSG